MRVALRTSVLFSLLASANLASAGAPHAAIGRYFGLGSGPGYHAYNNCPTPPRHGHHGPAYGPVYGGHDSTWHDAPIAQPVETIAPPRALPAPQPTPAKSEASSRRPSEPLLPSQRMSQQPVFWYK